MIVEGPDYPGDGSEVGAVASVEVPAEVPVVHLGGPGDSLYVLCSGDALDGRSYERGALGPGGCAEAADDASPGSEAPVCALRPGAHYPPLLPSRLSSWRVRLTLDRRLCPALFVSSTTSMPVPRVKQIWHLGLKRQWSLDMFLFTTPTLLIGPLVRLYRWTCVMTWVWLPSPPSPLSYLLNLLAASTLTFLTALRRSYRAKLDGRLSLPLM